MGLLSLNSSYERPVTRIVAICYSIRTSPPPHHNSHRTIIIVLSSVLAVQGIDCCKHRFRRSTGVLPQMERYASPEPRRGVRKAAPSAAPLQVDVLNISGDTGIEGLGVSPHTRLGDIQRQLCGVFQKPFPKMAVSLVAHGRVWDDFDSRPFEDASVGEVYTAVFEVTTQMQHFDEQRKGSHMISFCLPNGCLFRVWAKAPSTYGDLVERVARHFSSSQLTISRRDGTKPADYELVEGDEMLDLSF